MPGKTLFDHIGAPYRLKSGSLRAGTPTESSHFQPKTESQIGSGFGAKVAKLSRHAQILQIVHYLRTSGFAGAVSCTSQWEDGSPIEVTVDQDSGGWKVEEL